MRGEREMSPMGSPSLTPARTSMRSFVSLSTDQGSPFMTPARSFAAVQGSPSLTPARSEIVGPVVVGHRQPLIVNRNGQPTRQGLTVGEVAAGTAAGCAAICCCCPIGIASLVVCAVVKLPAGLARRAIVRRKRRRPVVCAKRRKSPAAVMWGQRMGFSAEDDDDCSMMRQEWGIPSAAPSPEVLAMEKEMLERFYSTGFWRSPSQREDKDGGN